jgi:cobalt-zinc-cadmium efflux system outer membrane protein
MRWLVAMLCLLASQAHAQVPLTLPTYLSRVGQSNLWLAAQRANVPLAEAQTVIAKAFPDPVLTAGLASLDVSGVGAQNNLTASVGVPLEWPTKRPARIALAEANTQVVNAELEDFVRLLRGGAATSWVDALFAERVLARRRQAAASLAELARVNEDRQREGAVSEVVVLQSRLEARRAQSEVLTAEGEARAARLKLQEQMGATEELPALTGELRLSPRKFVAQDLIDGALKARPDLRARQRATDAATSQLQLARANRGVDFTVSLGWLGYTAGAPNSAFQGPPYQTVSALLSAPLPFSRVFDGELRAAHAAQQQTSAQQDAATLKVTLEVRAALTRYEAAAARLAQFDESLLTDSDRMLEMARYAFAQGSSRLTDLLSAQRTWTETYLAWEAALADHARALVALETAAGTWDF